MLAKAVRPVPPFADVTFPVTLVHGPPVMPVTVTWKTHDPLAAIVPPERLTLPDPGVAVMFAPVPQLPVRPLGVDTTSPEGSESVTATPVSGTAFELAIVNCNDVLAFKRMLVAPNNLLIVGATAYVYPAVRVPNWVSGFVTTTSTAPAACAGVVAVI